MEQTRKNLKTSSWVVLIFAALSLLQIIGELLWGELNSARIPAGAPENTLQITKIFILVIAVLLLLPKVYVGVKGLRVAKKPNASKGHIIWAGIILVFAVLDLIDPVAAAIKSGSVREHISAMLSILLEVAIYGEYIKYARDVAKLAD